MRFTLSALLVIGCCSFTMAQTTGINAGNNINTGNIHTIKELYLEKVLHNPADREEDGEDNDLSRFNRWYNLMVPRTYPDGKLPSPSVLLKASEAAQAQARAAERVTAAYSWVSVGPDTVPSNYNGIGRVNCIVIDPVDTNRLYVGTACGGVWVSRNGGATWKSNSDNFPSLSVADIVVNPKHRDTVYAATGDGYGYINGSYSIFWGGLYSAGVMMSTDSGNTWRTTGLSYMQSQQDIVQHLLLHPNKTNILMAATTTGIMRSTDAGATWNAVTTGHTYSMAFRPFQPDTVYAVNTSDLIVSYNAGATWSTLYSGINTTGDRCTIAVSAASPNSIWILNAIDNLYRSYDGGNNFYPTTSSPAATASFYGYYDRVLAVSPADSNYVVACGLAMARSVNGGNSWSYLDATSTVHSDNHALTISPLHPKTIYSGNDGGIFVTHDGGSSWRDLGTGLVISQIYRMSASRQNPYIMLCGIQDNGTFYNNAVTWKQSSAPSGDGMDNAICPKTDSIQITSYQYGNFYVSKNKGATYSSVSFPPGITGSGSWTAPVAFNPNSKDTVYFGMKGVYASYNGGLSATAVSTTLFPSGAISIVVAPSAGKTIYASDYARIMRTTDGGTTWTDVSGNLPSGLAKMDIAVDYKNSQIVYATVSGYVSGDKVYKSTTGGTTWTNISTGLPNVPANCIAVDSSSAGALFVGTDMGVYYRNDTTTTFALYNTGLPNVIVDDIDINYYNYKVRAATYGRGVWECRLKKNPPPHTATPELELPKTTATVYPNPTNNSWKISFQGEVPKHYGVRLTDITGRTILTQQDNDVVEAAALAPGVYTLEVTSDAARITLKAVKN